MDYEGKEEAGKKEICKQKSSLFSTLRLTELNSLFIVD